MVNNVLEFKNFNIELFFVTDILKLESLHYGMWNRGDKFSIKNIRKSQKRYSDSLLTLIPPGVKTILDVGAGIGDIARALASKGYRVTAVSPDVNHQRFYDQSSHPNVKFLNVKFEDFQTDQRFDLILMAESNGYFDEDFSITRSFELLNPKGYLFISGLFRKEANKQPHSITNVEKVFLSKANDIGFNLNKRLDISEDIFPNIKYAYDLFNEYFYPSLDLVKLYFQHSDPLKFKILSFIFKRQIKEIDNIKTFYEKRVNPELFKENVSYLRLILQKNRLK